MISVRIDSSNPTHIRCTVFANGANCGRLTMRPDEFDAFDALLRGAQASRDYAALRALCREGAGLLPELASNIESQPGSIPLTHQVNRDKARDLAARMDAAGKEAE